MEIVIAIITLVCGFAIGFLLSNSKSVNLKTRIAVLESQISDLQTSEQQKLSEKDSVYQQILQAKDKEMTEALARQKQHERESLEALQGRFDETIAKMKAELENITVQTLKQRQEEFADSSKTSMQQILEPLNVNLKQMREAMVENTDKHSKLGGQLSANLETVLRHSDLARESAERLTEALKGGGKIQGDWGETVLKELLESQNLKEGIHFDIQATITDQLGNTVLSDLSNSRMRPDVILHLDDRREVIIDSKVSLTAFIDYVEAQTEDARNLALRRHIDSIEKHVKELSGKDYSSYIKSPKISVDYVIMFVPTSAALYTAVNAKRDLWRKAMEMGVYIADEQTLYAALKIINMTWRQIAQAENHQKVFGLASEMLDRVAAFAAKFSSIGSKLEDAQKAYSEAKAKLEDHGQSIPVTCNKLIRMGAKYKKLPKGVAPEILGFTQDTDL